MKQWLNKWEKLGDRLRNAKQKPESYVWDLIEQELDARADSRFLISRRVVAVIAVLFLIASVSGMLLFTPKADLALLNNHSNGLTLNSDDWVVSNNDLETAIVVAETEIANVGVIVQVMADEVRIEEKQSNDQSIASITIQSVEAVISQREVNEVFVPASEEIRIQRDHKVLFPVALESSAEVQVDNQLEIYQLQKLQSAFKLYELAQLQKRFNEISERQLVDNDIIVIVDEPHINANQSISQLHGELAQIDQNPNVDKDEALAFDDDLLAFQSRIEPKTGVELRKIRENVSLSEVGEQVALAKLEEKITRLEVEKQIEVESKSWITEALTELETWKVSLTEQKELESESSMLEELIDEAILDEEDPLTKRQNEAMDLYRTSNVNKGFHIGMVAGYQSTWVTKATRNPEIDRSVMKYRYNPGYQIGINMGYDITNHFGLMMEFKYSAEGGSYYNPLNDREQNLDLRYIEIPLYAKIKHSTMTDKMRPIVFNYLVGVTYKDLRNINLNDGGRDKRFGQDYNTSEWGLSTGFEFDYYINKNFFWTVGARAGIAGNAKSFPRFKGADGDGTMSISAGLFTRLNFRLPGK